jgi:hypothetical protein
MSGIKWFVTRQLTNGKDDVLVGGIYYCIGECDTAPCWVDDTSLATPFVSEEYADAAARGIAAIQANQEATVRLEGFEVTLRHFTFTAVSR